MTVIRGSGTLFIAGRSAGIVDKVYPVYDTVQSIFDPKLMASLSYSLHQNYNKKKRNLDVVFDHRRKIAISTLNEDAPKTLDIPEEVQDGLSFLYYLRTRDAFTIGKVITLNVLDLDKQVGWAMPTRTLSDIIMLVRGAHPTPFVQGEE